MIRNLLAPCWAAVDGRRNNATELIGRESRALVLALAGLIGVAVSLFGLPSKAHAARGWSLGSSISQTYNRRNWSAPAGKSATKKRRANKRNKKTYKVYRKKTKTSSKKKRRAKVASVNTSYSGGKKNKKSLSGGGVRWAASSSCLNGRLKSIIYQVAARYGSVTVSSTCRSKKRNARAGGAKRSKHLTGNAVDFRVHGRYGAAYSYLKSVGGVGGYKHYGGGLFHIDTGARRTW